MVYYEQHYAHKCALFNANTHNMKTVQLNKLRKRIQADGINMSAWARERGFKPQEVIDVLTGRTAAKRGRRYEVAITLEKHFNQAIR
jgi:gp16 family phage-associated protein